MQDEKSLKNSQKHYMVEINMENNGKRQKKMKKRLKR